VIYDRAISRARGRFKRFNLMMPEELRIQGRTATAKTSSGQQIFLTSLLPAAATLARAPDENDAVAEGETMRTRLFVEDPSRPSDVRFLHVLEGADAGAAPTPVERLESRGALPFDGVLVRGTAVLFPVNPIAANGFKELVYSVPAATRGHLITGLPQGRYDVEQKTKGGRTTIRITLGAALPSDEAGGIAIGSIGL
jgi:hypothetical protein